MKIIALQGHSNCGKTHVLNLFIKKVLKTYPAKIIKTSLKGYTLDDYCDEIKNANSVDTDIILEINKIKIGITTAGDNETILQNSFNKFKDCDLCFCSCRLKGKTIDFIKTQSKENYVFYNQMKIDRSKTFPLAINYDFINNEVADILLQTLGNLI